MEILGFLENMGKAFDESLGRSLGNVSSVDEKNSKDRRKLKGPILAG